MFRDVDSDDDIDNTTYEGISGTLNFSKRAAPAPEKEEDDEDDPLDAYMAQINAELKTCSTNKASGQSTEPAQKRLRIEEYEHDAEEEKELETLMKLQAEARQKRNEAGGANDDDSDDYDDDGATAKLYLYDSDDEGGSISAMAAKKKPIEPLAPLDHSQISYAPFEKNFYYENPDVEKLSEEEVNAIREKHGIRIFGNDILNPVTSFDQIDLGRRLAPAKRVLQSQGFAAPMPIQMQAIPAGLNGRDIIGIAKTGSGKTLAYILPMLAHVVPQERLHKGDGPIAVVLVPTRELAQQVYLETKKYATPLGLRVSAVYGGVSKYEQFKELKNLCEILVATPGRLIDLIKMKGTNMHRCTFLVLDEADRMFDMGFEGQVRSIAGQIRPDRQTLLFSATMRRREESLAQDILDDPLRIAVGEIGKANTDVKQITYVVNTDEAKMGWLLKNIETLVGSGSVLIFASQKAKTEEIAAKLCERGCRAAAIHGDKNQAERQRIIFAFKNENIDILVATDMVSRGLDVKAVKTVVNYDTPKNIESYVHRIGRTGRAGAQDGVAYTFVLQKETNFAGQLVQCLEQVHQPVPKELLAVAQRNPKFKTRRSGIGMGRTYADSDPAPSFGAERYAAPVKKSAFLSKFVKSSDVKVYSSKAEMYQDKRTSILPPSQASNSRRDSNPQPIQSMSQTAQSISRWDNNSYVTQNPPQTTQSASRWDSNPHMTQNPPQITQGTSRWDNPTNAKKAEPKKSIEEEIQAWKAKYGL